MKVIFSIIVPTYNRAHFLGATIDSIIAQSFSAWECIVVDDGSADYTKELMEFYLKKDFRIKYLHRPAEFPKGANSCRNYGFEKSRGSYINWFDSDDVMLPGFIKENLDLFQDDIDFVICPGYFVDQYLKIISPMHVKEIKKLYKEYLIWNQKIITNSVIFKRSFLTHKNLFDPRLSRGQEAELFSRLFFQVSANKYGVNSNHLFLYRQHAGTKTSGNVVYNKENKESESFIYVENIKRSEKINEKELITVLYKRLIILFFLGLENGHTSNSSYILKNLWQVVFKYKRRLGVEILSLGKLLIFLKRGSYQLEKKWLRESFYNKDFKNSL